MKILENSDVMDFRQNFQSGWKHIFATPFWFFFGLEKRTEKIWEWSIEWVLCIRCGHVRPHPLSFSRGEKEGARNVFEQRV
jgi:hypothetical protein